MALAISAALSLGLSVFGYIRRRARGAIALTLCSLLSFLWACANALEIAGADLSTKLFWANVEYIPISFIPLACLGIALRFANKDQYLTPSRVALSAIVPAATSALVWLDPVLGLVRHSFSLDTGGDFPVIAKAFGPWYWFHCVYSYAAMGAGIFVLIGLLRDKGSFRRRQTAVILSGFALVFLVNILYVTRLGPIRRFDTTPIAFSLAAMIFWHGIFRYQMYSALPVARNAVFEGIANGILVIDRNWRLLDSNPAAARIFGFDAKACAGKSLRELLPDLCATIDENMPISEGSFLTFRNQLRVQAGGGESYYSLSASHILDERYRDALVLILTDIDEFRNAHKEILSQREELAAASERDKIAKELHDSLGETLSLAVIQSDAALAQIEKGNHSYASLYLARLRELLNSARDNLNDYVYGALETQYEGISIQSLLEKEADIFARSCAIPVDLHISQDMRTFPFSGFQKLNLVRAVKEALNNVARHAGASSVVISLESCRDEISLCVEDDGIGLDFDEAGQAEGAGMRTLEERAIALGGRRVVEARPEGGTRVCISFSPESPAAR